MTTKRRRGRPPKNHKPVEELMTINGQPVKTKKKKSLSDSAKSTESPAKKETKLKLEKKRSPGRPKLNKPKKIKYKFSKNLNGIAHSYDLDKIIVKTLDGEIIRIIQFSTTISANYHIDSKAFTWDDTDYIIRGVDDKHYPYVHLIVESVAKVS